MKSKIFVLMLLCFSALSAQNQSFYDFSAESLEGKKIDMSEYKGKVVLVVNTASKCGFTPQYKELQALYEQYKDQGFVILGFPCNQFGKQEPGTSEEIASFCERNYGVTFPMFEKIDVNGENAHPIYKFLKGKFPGEVEWNFGKFLIDKNGNPVERFSPKTTPFDIRKDIEELL